MKSLCLRLIFSLILLVLLSACQNQAQDFELPTVAVLPSLTPPGGGVNLAPATPTAEIAPTQDPGLGGGGAPPPTDVPSAAAQTLDLVEAYQQTDLSFDYPAGWIAVSPDDNDQMVMLANSQRVIDGMEASDSSFVPQPGDVGMFIFVVPPMIAEPDQSPSGVLQAFLQFQDDPSINVGSITVTSIASNPAALAQVSSDEGQGVFMAIDTGGGFAVLFAVTPAGELSGWVSTINDVAASVVVTAPAS